MQMSQDYFIVHFRQFYGHISHFPVVLLINSDGPQDYFMHSPLLNIKELSAQFIHF
jgi:hypothetical protein